VTAPDSDRRLWVGYLLVLGAYFSLQTVVRVLVSPSPELDEAEQLIWTQHWALGYGTQPPLYTWLQKVWFSLTGVSILGLATLKNALLWVCYAATAAAVRRIAGTGAGIVAGASMLWLPSVGWESQRDLTHTVLATALAALALWLFTRVATRGLRGDYVAFGMAVGAGLLAKYNFVLFLGLLVLATAFVPPLRQRWLSRDGVWAAVVALAICLPHLFWVTEQWLAATQGTFQKLIGGGVGRDIRERLSAAALGWLGFVTPWWIAFALAAWPGGARVKSGGGGAGNGSSPWRRWALIYVAGSFALLVLLAVLGSVQIKVRWLQPPLFVLPALAVLVLRIDARSVAWRRYLMATCVLAMLLATLMAVRAPFQAAKGRPDEWNVPLPALADAIRQAGFEAGEIISPQAWLAGGLRLQFPDARVRVGAAPIPGRSTAQLYIVALDPRQPLPAWPAAENGTPIRLPVLYARPHTPPFEAHFVILPATTSP